eukprot:5386330-Prymnesium_polylepis.2
MSSILVWCAPLCCHLAAREVCTHNSQCLLRALSHSTCDVDSGASHRGIARDVGGWVRRVQVEFWTKS